MARSDEVHTYLEGVLLGAGKADLPPGGKEAAIKQLASALYALIEDTNLGLLPSNDLDAYLELFRHGSNRQEKEQFLMSKIPDYQVILDQVFDDFHSVATAILKDADVDPMSIQKIIVGVVSRRKRWM